VLLVPVSVGELVDKITILKIKVHKLPKHLAASAERELQFLEDALNSSLYGDKVSSKLIADLERVNRRLWDVEDRLRELEQNQDFRSEFVELARSVYRLNDERFVIKKEINSTLNSEIVEVKSHNFAL